jgi:hypothetical protein
MNTETRDYLKIGLLGVIAVCLVYGTFFKTKRSSKRSLQSTIQSTPPNQQQSPLNDLSVSIDPNKEQGQNHNYGTTTISWDKETHDFGVVKQHTTNTYKFSFTNSGNQPLVISDAQGSCGCTVPEYPKEPVMPGEAAEITVNYSPGTQMGPQQKTVTLTTNTQPNQHMLVIKANVEEAPDPLLE